MNFTGKITELLYTAGGKQHISLELNEKKDIKHLRDCVLDIDIRKHREKRSINANSYFWKLVDAIKNTRDKSEDEVYQMMLAQYGQNQYRNDGNIAMFTVPYDTKLEGEFFTHSAPVKTVELNGKLFTHYRMLRGSSTYDTREMSILIDGIVSEAKELGIETKPENEIKSMMEELK